MTNTQEIKTVSYEEYMRELSKLRGKYRGSKSSLILGCGSYFEIYEIGSIFESSPIQVGVNWAAMGTVSPEETEEFACALLKAAEDCKNFKYNGYVIDWTAPSKASH